MHSFYIKDLPKVCTMKQKRNAVMLALLGILIFAIALKYPQYSHQYLPDSPDFHVMTNLVNTYGRPIWSMHLLSYWGAYPFSEPLGIVFMLSATSQLGQIHVEPSMIVVNAGALFVGILSSFCLGRKIFKSNLAGLITGLFFVYTSARHIFIATPRPIAAAFFPLIILFLLFAYERKSQRFRFLSFFSLTLIIAFGIHRLTLFLLPVIIVFAIIVPLYDYLKRKVFNPFMAKRRHHWKINRGTVLKMIFIPGLLLGVLLIILVYYTHMFHTADFLTDTALFTGDSLRIQTINFLYYLGKQMGPISVFAVVGLFLLLKKSTTSYEAFLYFGMVSLIPFSMRHAYVWNVWQLFITLLAGYGTYRIIEFFMIKERFKLLKIPLFAILILSPVIATSVITLEEPFVTRHPWTVVGMTDEEWETGIYFSSYLEPDESGFSTTRGHGLAAISNRNHLNLGMHGIEMIWANRSIVNELDIVFVGDDVLNESLDQILLSKGVLFYVNNDPLFPERGKYYRDLHWIWLQRKYDGDEYETIVHYYRLRLFSFYKLIPDERYRGYRRIFRDNVYTDAYKVYENSFYESYNVP